MGLFGDITDAIGITNYGDAEAEAKKTQDLYNQIKLPELEPYQLQQLVDVGQISPQEAQAAMVQKSAYSDISNDPALRNAQMQSLQQLQNISTQGGLTAEDRALQNQLSNQIATEQRGQREAILQGAARRGTMSGGATLMDQMLGQQQNQTRQAQGGLDIAANAQKRSLEAIMNSGNLGGQIRGQDYSEAANKAAALDKIAQFNAQNAQQNLMNNAQQRAAVAQYNNQIANNQLGQANELAQQKYLNQMGLTAGKAGANKTAQEMYEDQSKTNLGAAMGIGSAIATGGASLIPKR